MLNAPLLTSAGSAAMTAPAQQAMHMGFQEWAPSAPPPESTYGIYGTDYSQILELDVLPGEIMTAEPGTMLMMTSGMEMAADMGGLGQALTRSVCAGESLFRLKLHNTGNNVEQVALTPTFPAKIIPIDLREHSGMAMNRGAFLGAKGTNWSIKLESVRSLGVFFFGGQGLFLNRLHGDGVAFLNGGGSIMTKQLREGEELTIDKHSLLAMERTVQLSIRRTGGFMVCCCAGQGLFNAVLKGPGWVIIHTMPLAKLSRAVGPTDTKGDTANSGGDS